MHCIDLTVDGFFLPRIFGIVKCGRIVRVEEGRESLIFKLLMQPSVLPDLTHALFHAVC